MCGIVACVSPSNAIKESYIALKKLEYRGYDSSGIAFVKNASIECVKSLGGVENIFEKVKNLSSNTAIAHTRWATHGNASLVNAHPHLSFDGSLSIVHNGIIENYQSLKEELTEKNIAFKSDTDTEVIASYIASSQGTMLEKIKSFMQKAKGSYACALLTSTGELYAFKSMCPLYYCEENIKMFSSDIICFSNIASKYYSLLDGEIMSVISNKTTLYSKDGEIKNITFSSFNSEDEDASKGDFKHFMQKEIRQTPSIIEKINKVYTKEFMLSALNLLHNTKEILLVGCGTAYHACKMGAKFLEENLNKPCRSFVASELLYSKIAFDTSSVCIFVSQSGETADTLNACKKLKAEGLKTIGLTNVAHSTLAKECDVCLPTLAGVEVAVASTKAYSGQVFALYKLAKGYKNEITNECVFKDFDKLLEIDEKIIDLVSKAQKVFFIGRGIDSITSEEAALKLKEISYIMAEGYPAGELKHGTLALIEKGTIVFVIATQEKQLLKTISNLKEVKARGAITILVTNHDFGNVSDYTIKLPSTKEELMSIVSIIPLQEMAYKVSVKLGNDPDKPRNLAKSVTVE